MDAAETYARTVLANTDDPRLKASMARRLQQLRSARILDRIDAAIARYRKLHGAPPATVGALVRDGLLDKPPVDPLGGTYSIVHGRAYATSLRKGSLHVFTEPQQ